MAGGVGSRFWPLSKSSTPKQFLDMLGTGKSLLRQTFERFTPICKNEHFIVVTSAEYKDKVLEHLPELKPEQVLLEPFRRNTAPCIAYANAFIRSKNKNARIVVTPADHLILDESEFITTIKKSLEFVSSNNALLTLGIKPHRPETGYGYIQVGKPVGAEFQNFNEVKTFTEKPNLELAKVFQESGEFFWNSGIFLWTLKSIDEAFNQFLPEIQSLFNKLETTIGSVDEYQSLYNTYIDCKNVSIDYGVMEKAKNVFVQTVNFGWSDLGAWSSLHEYSPRDENKNAVVSGKVLLYETSDTVLYLPKNKVGVIQGLTGFVIVDSGDALLICKRNDEQKIKEFTADIKTWFGEESL